MLSREKLEKQHQKHLSRKSHKYSNFTAKFDCMLIKYNFVNDINDIWVKNQQ